MPEADSHPISYAEDNLPSVIVCKYIISSFPHISTLWAQTLKILYEILLNEGMNVWDIKLLVVCCVKKKKKDLLCFITSVVTFPSSWYVSQNFFFCFVLFFIIDIREPLVAWENRCVQYIQIHSYDEITAVYLSDERYMSGRSMQVCVAVWDKCVLEYEQ